MSGATEPRVSTDSEHYKKTIPIEVADDTNHINQKKRKVTARGNAFMADQPDWQIGLPYDVIKQSDALRLRASASLHTSRVTARMEESLCNGARSAGIAKKSKLTLVSKQTLLPLRCHYVNGESHYMKEHIYFVGGKSLGEPRLHSNGWLLNLFHTA